MGAIFKPRGRFLKEPAGSVFRRPAPAPGGASRTITIAGSGYAGSTYTSDRAGQWTADGAAISGATGTSYAMTTANEGRAIRCADSNIIQMWTPGALPTGYRANGGWWCADDQISAGGLVSAWPDRWGVRDMTQTVDASKPSTGTIGGQACAVWPSTDNNCYLAPAGTFAPGWWLSVLQYKDGLVGAFDTYERIIGAAGPPNHVFGSAGTSNLYQYTAYAIQARKNGAAALDKLVLPLPLSLLSFYGTPASALWSIGRGNSATVGWKGPRCMDLALGSVPTQSEREQIEGYAAHKYGITSYLPSAHPYKSAAPRVQ